MIWFIFLIFILKELREDNTILIETKNMLEEQLSNCHKRVETVVELENELRKKRQMVEEMALVWHQLTNTESFSTRQLKIV